MKMVLTIIIAMMFSPVFAPSVKMNRNAYENYLKKEIFEAKKMILLKAIIKAEKPNNDNEAWEAYVRENARGILQIQPIMVRSCNKIIGYQKYFLADRRDSTKSVEMFYIYQNHFNIDFNPELAAYLWNGGEGYENANEQTKQALSRYWERVNANLKKLNYYAI